jgi:hypothetical protein
MQGIYSPQHEKKEKKRKEKLCSNLIQGPELYIMEEFLALDEFFDQ